MHPSRFKYSTAQSTVTIALSELEVIAEDRTLLPSPVSEFAEVTAAEFWRRLDTYAEFKNHNEAAKLELAKAMFVQAGRDWLKSLPDASKDTQTRSNI